MRLELPRALKSHGFARAGSNPVPDDYILSFFIGSGLAEAAVSSFLLVRYHCASRFAPYIGTYADSLSYSA